MDAVVSLLDADHERRVRDLWRELEADFGVLRVREILPFPHVTFQGAESYDERRVGPLLERLAHAARPFVIRTAGLGIFTGTKPVLTVAVARDAALDAFHRLVWDTLGAVASELSPYYAPGDRWMPHVTLAQHDLERTNLPAIVGALCERDFAWEIRIENLALLVKNERDETFEVRRYEFGVAR